MTTAIPTSLLLKLCQASPETLGAIERFLPGEPLESAECGVRSAELKRGRADGCSQAGTEGGPAYVFRWTGRDWEVVFGGGKAFHLPSTLGARYLNHLLHGPNESISAFDLEVLITPEKGEARSKESIQPESDSRAKRAYRRALRPLQAERRRAKKAGDQARVRDLDLDIEKINAALNKRGGMADTGERARSNVHHAVRGVVKLLRKGGPQERAFAEHLQACLSTGHECLYNQPAGRIWA